MKKTGKCFGRQYPFSAYISVATQNHRSVEVGRQLWRFNLLLYSKQSQLQPVDPLCVQSALSITKDGDSTASLDNLFQCLICKGLHGKSVFLHLNVI